MRKRTLPIGAAVVLACLALVSVPGAQQRTVVKGRLPFQTLLNTSLGADEIVDEDSFLVPFNRRLEILNVAANLRFIGVPDEFEVVCAVLNAVNEEIASMPVLMTLIHGGPDDNFITWGSAQPTLLHVEGGQRLVCRLVRVQGASPSLANIDWTISGFTDDPS